MTSGSPRTPARKRIALPPTPVATLTSVRVQTQRLLLDQAERAAQDGDHDRFDQLISRLMGDSLHDDDGLAVHERRLDRWRVITTGAMVGALFVIIVLVTFNKTAGENGVQYVSLFSGLAGIALGWLFGAGSSPLRRDARSRPGGGLNTSEE